jgi:uncharacterized protein with FMN-binding domain
VRKTLKRVGIGLLIFVAAVMVYAMLGMRDTLNMTIGTADLSTIPDGDYTGAYDCYRWSNEVRVSVRNHAITGIEVLKAPSGREGIAGELSPRILEAQTPALDAVSGATADKKAFLKAVENALRGAAPR